MLFENCRVNRKEALARLEYWTRKLESDYLEHYNIERNLAPIRVLIKLLKRDEEQNG